MSANLPNPSMSFSPFAILTAEEMNNILENINSLADGTGFDAGAIGTSDIAALAVTQPKMNLAMTAFTNPGTAGGTGFYINLGGMKILVIKGLLSNASAWLTVNWTTVGFSAIPYVAGNSVTQQGGGISGGWVEFTSLSAPANGTVEQNGASILTRTANSTNTAVNVNLIVIGT